MVFVTKNELAAYAETCISSMGVGKHATVIGLSGDLGAGKTTFTQLVAQLLGISEVVVSPTFVIMKRYVASHPLYSELIHIDAYRLSGGEELVSLGFLDWCSQPNTLIIVEWPEKIAEILPPHTRTIAFKVIDENTREISPQ